MLMTYLGGIWFEEQIVNAEGQTEYGIWVYNLPTLNMEYPGMAWWMPSPDPRVIAQLLRPAQRMPAAPYRAAFANMCLATQTLSEGEINQKRWEEAMALAFPESFVARELRFPS